MCCRWTSRRCRLSTRDGTCAILLGFFSSSQQGWRHCAPRIDNVPHVYGERTLQNSTAVSGARSEYFQFRSVRQDIPYTGYDHVGNQEPVANIMPYRAAHHPGSTSSPVGYRVEEYAFG
ncbi:hypothetical protein JB92DRAFT_2978836 [Gautieria morchelliformis]|nr:hypothetical protein JB92DRAFT_2978836 [Gautieria morchelliformis]